MAALPATMMAATNIDTQSEQFKVLMQAPENPEHSFQFAVSAIQSGNINGAIAALERVLQINPQLDNIRLELGVLYLQVGAKDLAAQYLEEALSSPDIPVAVRNRAKIYRQQATRTAPRHTVSQNFGVATHIDDNAKAAPSDREVLVAGFPALLDEADTGRSDTSLSLSYNLQHDYLFERQSGTRLESSFASYNRRYSDASDINLDYLALETGPRFYYGSVLNPSWSLRPFLNLTLLRLNGDAYQNATEIGLNTQHIFNAHLMGNLSFRLNYQDFQNSALRPHTSKRSGAGITLNGALTRNFSRERQGFMQLGISQHNAKVDYEATQRTSLAMGLNQSYRAPFGIGQFWRATASISYGNTQYDAPDPAIDPSRARDDKRIQFRFANNFALTSQLYSVVEIFIEDNNSNLPNYKYDNTGIVMSFRRSF